MLPHPTATAKDVFDACVESIRNPALRRRFELASEHFFKANQLYKKRGHSGELLKFSEHTTSSGFTKEELNKLYDRLRNNEGPRVHYDAIIEIPEMCPYCLLEGVNTLDHVLPKASYPVFSITPLNLVGSCSTCNNSKGNISYNPYFDNIRDAKWLIASVEVETTIEPMVVRFGLDIAEETPEARSEEITVFFNTLHLSRRYSIKSVSLLRENEKIFYNLFFQGGVDALREHLFEMAHSCLNAYEDNYWKTAFYYALANSNWFLSFYARSSI